MNTTEVTFVGTYKNPVTDLEITEYIKAKFAQASKLSPDGYARLSIEICGYGSRGCPSIKFRMDNGKSSVEAPTLTECITKGFPDIAAEKREQAQRLINTAQALIAEANSLRPA